jgi:hypothetical protein
MRAAVCPSYIPDILPLDRHWSRSKIHSLLDWLKFYTNLVWGVKIHSVVGNFCRPRGSARIRKKKPELQTRQAIKKGNTHFERKRLFLTIPPPFIFLKLI